MTPEQTTDFALSETQCMRVLAGQYRQGGFKNLAAHLNEQANRAERSTLCSPLKTKESDL